MIYGNAEKPDSEFFLDEVREGFFVTSMMKRYWAAQIKVLSVIDGICEKHGIRWFADCGTLLGAVRHGGYIPWDDDLDICMLRSDYEKFCSVADSELPSGYRFLNVHREDEYTMMIGRIVNSSGIDYSRAHMDEYFGCPYTIGIDIFILDGLAVNDDAEESRLELLEKLTKAIGFVNSGDNSSAELKGIISDIELFTHEKINVKGNLQHELLVAADRIYAAYPDKDAEYVALMTFWSERRTHRYSKSFYEHVAYISYEYIKIPVPYRYEEVLSALYGNYMNVFKGGGLHDYPVYKEQESILKANLGGNPFRYTMPKGELRERTVKTTEESCRELLSVISQAHGQIERLCSQGEYEMSMSLLTGCQNLAVTLGTLLEDRINGCREVVADLEEYCEMLYMVSTDYRGDESIIGLDGKLSLIRTAVEKLLKNRKREILFLVCRADWWGSAQNEWKKACADPDNSVYVMPVSYALCGDEKWRNEAENFAERYGLEITEEYDMEKRHPDVIFFQVPYDGFSDEFSVPERFFSDRLLQLTDELVYIPPYATDDPEMTGDKLSVSLRMLIEQPAVRNADRVMVCSEQIKQLYVDTLTEICGNNEYWSAKIVVSEKTQEKDSQRVTGYKHKDKKYVIFQVSAPFIVRFGESAIKKISDSIDIMKLNRDRITVIFSPHESLDKINDIGDDNRRMWERLLGFLEGDSDIVVTDHNVGEYITSADGYYGCPGVTAHRCVQEGVPVMIMSLV